MSNSCISYEAIQQNGFTLIELIVTLSVVSILLSVAAPSYRTFVQDSLLSAQNNSFYSALALAKSEAIRRSSFATVCPSTNGTGCTGGKIWSNGWLVFADDNGNGIVEAGEQILQVNAALSGGNTMKSAARTRVTFSASGFSSGYADTFSLCDSRGASHSKAIVLNNQGRFRSETGTGACS
ncbi:MAG: prepilin-type N-terminal cleavage/methylation domain-containing protein [Nitrosomonas sp.]|nr:MAG: prepilin-type N-terminal cleavage/methylation domain-containing protein [Nitrosomonas sp.]